MSYTLTVGWGILVIPCQILHPVEAVDLKIGDYALEELIAFQAGIDNPRGCAEPGSNHSQGKHHKKHKNGIILEYEADISAGFHQSEQARRLITCSDHGHSHYRGKLTSIFRRFRSDA